MKLKFWEKSEESKIDNVINDQLDQLECSARCSEEEEKAIENLERLASVKVQVEGQKQKINPNTILSAVVTVGTALLMLNYEKLNVITSKALNFLPKPRL